MSEKKLSADLLVVGAGIAGITTALEAAETGYEVVLIEKRPYIGGRVAQLNQYFPKMCPPACGLEINTRRLKDNPKIKLLTMADLQNINGKAGNFTIDVKVNPRYTRDDCTNFEEIADKINARRKNEFNYNLDETKALYYPFNNAYPQKWVFDKKVCTGDELKHIANNFTDCIDLEQDVENYTIDVKSIVWATGWEPYNAKKLETLGYGLYPEVVTNVELERLSAPSGPTAGKIMIPGSEKEIKSIAFVQCAGSRDEKHLEYCSGVCCLASMKQARYIREQYPGASINIFYIDVRANGALEEFYNETKDEHNINFYRGKVAKVFKNNDSGRLVIEFEDTIQAELRQAEVDMVVLATGMKPATKAPGITPEMIDSTGFLKVNGKSGMSACGVCTRPKDVATSVQEATGAAIRAIHTIKGN